jgi:hypothetical protein
VGKYTLVGAGIAQSVLRLTTGWAAEGSEVKCRQRKYFSLLSVVPTGCGPHPDSSPIGTGGGGFSSGGEATGA